MLNPFVINDSRSRIREWRSCRIQLQEKTNYEQLKSVVNFWSLFPRSEKEINLYRPDTWPDPWELLNTNRACSSEIALGMFYTLYYSKCYIDLKLINVFLLNEQKELLTVLVDNKYFLNFSHNDIFLFDFAKGFNVLLEYDFCGKWNIITTK